MTAATVRGWAAATNSVDALPAVPITLPTRVAGDLLLAFASEDATTALTITGAWVELFQSNGTGIRFGMWGRIATNDANDNLSIAGGNSVDLTANIVAITVGTHGVTDVFNDMLWAAAATAASGNADPPSHSDPTAKDYLAIATACVDLTATGSAITAAPTGFTSNAIMQKSASSTSSVALGVGFQALTNLSTINPGAFTNTSGAWVARTLFVPPAAASIPQGSATGTIGWVGSVTATTQRRGAANGAIAYSGSVTGTTVRRGSANGSIAYSGSVTGVRTPKAAANGAIGWVGSVQGDAPADIMDGAVNGTITWSGSVTGVRSPKASVNGSISWVGIVIGGNLGFVLGSVSWNGIVAGVRSPKSVVNAAVMWSGTINGEAPGVGPKEGSANGAISWVGSVTGKTLQQGSIIETIVWAGFVNGSSPHSGIISGEIMWVGTVTSPFAIDPSTFLLKPHVIGYKPRIMIGYRPRIISGHKPHIAKGRDGG